jgi:hypothetical protein
VVWRSDVPNQLEEPTMVKKTPNDDLIGAAPAPSYPPMSLAAFAACIGVPLSLKGQPNLRDHKPNRFVPLDEAKFYGASWHWPGQVCRYGHIGPRRTANPRICGSCERVTDGQPTIYPDSKAGTFYEIQPKVAAAATPAPAPQLPEPDPADRKFLAALAEHRSVAKAAAAVGSTTALIEARRASNAAFRTAMDELETRLQIVKATLPEPDAFNWTPEIEQKLVTLWINTGDLQTACDNCGVTRSEYFKHLERSYVFARAIEDAAPRAEQALEDRAVQMSLAGNDRLLAKLLAAKKPDVYGERARIDLNVKGNAMSPAEMTAMFNTICANLDKRQNLKLLDDNGNAIEGQIVEQPKLPAPKKPDDDDANEVEA